ncbi:hypothetical protein PoB_001232700 [Plakobranchus ocellatus]|uniref:Secreted protein n=1 Tax=Plakobranchus ocellatus TaxID=259542 RepID=A0AAV3YUJ1_9GAST|nr:hypothetical protein PoB_001232700 [Plakobranchus ocellatus]
MDRNKLRWLSLRALVIACPTTGGHNSGIAADKQQLGTSRCTVTVYCIVYSPSDWRFHKLRAVHITTDHSPIVITLHHRFSGPATGGRRLDRLFLFARGWASGFFQRFGN